MDPTLIVHLTDDQVRILGAAIGQKVVDALEIHCRASISGNGSTPERILQTLGYAIGEAVVDRAPANTLEIVGRAIGEMVQRRFS
jgi:alkylhydroperoxidase/carboxymuconolactone decarboxylase family protein YurZ